MTETENTFLIGTRRWNETERDRLDYNRLDLLEDALDAWKDNPLARRIVELTSQYVVGGGIEITCTHEPTREFLKAWWNHRLNRMPVRVFEWCDELSRSGNLFVLITTDPAGFTYVRAVPAADIDLINHVENDIEQPTEFITRLDENAIVHTYHAYNEEDDPLASSMLQYAINRPVGAQWGESDLSPILRWLSRYANWLEDRARLNRYRTAFLYIVKGQYASETERAARQTDIATTAPTPGSILVTDQSEEWTVINPQLASDDANNDGLALKKMIAAGAGLPLHFLAEPESSTRTTAEAAGGPTFRRFQQRQEFFIWMLQDLLKIVLLRRSFFDSAVDPKAEIEIRPGDISARDNVSLAMAGSNITNVMMSLYDRGLVDSQEVIRMVYAFTGQIVDPDKFLPPDKVAEGDELPTPKPVGQVLPSSKRTIPAVQTPSAKILDPDTGEVKNHPDLLSTSRRQAPTLLR